MITKRSSLFTKIFLGFLTIIILLSIILLVSFGIFRNSVRQEIVSFHELSLAHTVSNYENRLNIVKNLLLTMYYDEDVSLLYQQLQRGNKQNVDYLRLNNIWSDIRAHAANPLLNIENIALYFDPLSFVVEKDGTHGADEFFSKYLSSPDYTLDFFDQQMSTNQLLQTFPAASFKNYYQASKELLPVVLSTPSNHYLIAGFLDADKMFNTLHPSADGNFYIYNKHGGLLYTSAAEYEDDSIFNDINANQGYLTQNHHYYFYHKGASTGLIYIHEVPMNRIAARISSLNQIAGALFIFAVALSIILAIWMSRRFNQPLLQLIQAVVNQKPPSSMTNSPAEFHLLLDKLSHIFTEIKRKDAVLTNYSFMNQMRRIHSSSPFPIPLDHRDGSFILVLCHINLREHEEGQPVEKVSYFIREFIDLFMSDRFSKSRTFQMDANEVLTVVFDVEERQLLTEAAARMKQIYDQDVDHYLITVCISGEYQRTQQFEEAYRQVQQLLRQRMMIQETQIISELATHIDFPLYRESDLEILFNHLEQGNASAVIELTDTLIEQLRRKKAPALQYRQLAERIVIKRDELAFLIQGQYQSDRLKDRDEINGCLSAEELSAYLRGVIYDICVKIEERKLAKDDVIDFVLHYVEHHYNEDLSLDSVASKINLSSGYLSNYIKQKTGVTFSEHIMEVRIRKAKEMLRDSSLPIGVIAEKIGYYSATSFNRWFKKATGLSPGEYRRQSTLKH